MKNRISYIITLAAAFCFLFAMTSFAIGNAGITSLTASATKTSVTVSGTTEENTVVAVAVQVKSGDNIVAMQSFDTVGTTFAGTIDNLTLPAGQTLTVRAANYDGSDWFTTTVTVQDDPQPIPPSDGGSIRTYKEGWVEDSIGWWYRRADGTWPANCWVQLPWQGGMEWYHFGPDGYMQTGWFTDADGYVYYLWPIRGEILGRMVSGPQLIGGVPFNFNTVHDGHFGALIK